MAVAAESCRWCRKTAGKLGVHGRVLEVRWEDRKFTVLSSDVNRRFIKALGVKGFVGKVNEKKDKIVVNVMTSALK
jgi:hypothetical protein